MTLRLLALVLGLLLVGCAGGYSEDASYAPAPGAPSAAPMAPEEANQNAGYDFEDAPDRDESLSKKAAPPGAFGGGAAPARGERAKEPAQAGDDPTTVGEGAAKSRAPLLIYDATITLSVFEVALHIDAIEKLAQESGGYLVRRADQEVTIRVPAAGFSSALDAIAKRGDELHREVSVKDVTAQFTDLEIRLQNARVVRGRLEELLAKAANVEDALAVERELERLSREIETILGQLKLMSELIAFSTITVRFEARPQDQVQSQIPLPFPWLRDLGLPNLLSL